MNKHQNKKKNQAGALTIELSDIESVAIVNTLRVQRDAMERAAAPHQEALNRMTRTIVEKAGHKFDDIDWTLSPDGKRLVQRIQLPVTPAPAASKK